MRTCFLCSDRRSTRISDFIPYMVWSHSFLDTKHTYLWFCYLDARLVHLLNLNSRLHEGLSMPGFQVGAGILDCKLQWTLVLYWLRKFRIYPRHRCIYEKLLWKAPVWFVVRTIWNSRMLKDTLTQETSRIIISLAVSKIVVLQRTGGYTPNELFWISPTLLWKGLTGQVFLKPHVNLLPRCSEFDRPPVNCEEVNHCCSSLLHASQSMMTFEFSHSILSNS